MDSSEKLYLNIELFYIQYSGFFGLKVLDVNISITDQRPFFNVWLLFTLH